MNYIYNDEDNNPMWDDPFDGHNPTVYNSRAEMEYYESGRADQDKDAEWQRRLQKEQEALDGLADILELTGGCRECPYFTELAEGFLDGHDEISGEQLQFLDLQCSLCGGKGTGKPKDEKHEKWVDNNWYDLVDWVKQMGLKFHCCWCPTVYRIYGQYKDPDDEWNAIDSPDACANCKYFQED